MRVAPQAPSLPGPFSDRAAVDPSGAAGTSATRFVTTCRVMPMVEHENGLPLGIQAQAAQANDGLLLQLAAQIERALDGRWNGGRRPRVHVARSA